MFWIPKLGVISNFLFSTGRYLFPFFSLLAFLLAPLEAFSELEDGESGDYHSVFFPFAEYALGKTVGVDCDYGHFGLLVGKDFLYQCDAYIPISDKCGGWWAYSVGAVIRNSTLCSSGIWGVNAFYDFRQGCIDNFHQIGIGCERLSCTWDLRANAYFPLRRQEKNEPVIFDNYEGNYFATCQLVEYAAWSVNAELGRWLCLEKYLTTYQAVSPYLFSFKSYDYITGVYYRGLYQLYSWLTAEVVVSYDSFFHTRVQGLFKIILPLKRRRSCIPISPCERRVERFDMIILSQDCCWTWNW